MKKSDVWGDEQTKFFYEITPDVVLDTVETLGTRATGRVLQLNSMENRVYEAELDLDEVDHPWEKSRVIKFYRPGRWSKEQILEEHQFLAELKAADLPVVAPLAFSDGSTLTSVSNGAVYAAIFPKVGGRIPDEFSDEQLMQVGRLIGRLHCVGESKPAVHRLELSAITYGYQNLDYLLSSEHVSPDWAPSYRQLVEEICQRSEYLFEGMPTGRLHGDLHRSNILWGGAGLSLVDFDDMVTGPWVQDLWLLIPGRDQESMMQWDLLIEGYQQFRDFRRSDLRYVEPLRALRMIHFAAWIARRWEDPAFQRAFPTFGTPGYWREHMSDLQEQLEIIRTVD